MGKRRWILILFPVAVALMGFCWLLFNPNWQEPVSNGKPLGYWLARATGWETDAQTARKAIQHIGSNAAPVLLAMISQRDSDPKYTLAHWISQCTPLKLNPISPMVNRDRALTGYQILGPQAAGTTRGLVKLIEDRSRLECHFNATVALAYIGPGARDAVPALVRLCASTNQALQGNAIFALGEIHANPVVSVPCLIESLRSPASYQREWAVQGLGQFGPEAKSAIPALMEYSYSPLLQPPAGSHLVTLNKIQHSLHQIDPRHYPEAGAGP